MWNAPIRGIRGSSSAGVTGSGAGAGAAVVRATAERAVRKEVSCILVYMDYMMICDL